MGKPWEKELFSLITILLPTQLAPQCSPRKSASFKFLYDCTATLDVKYRIGVDRVNPTLYAIMTFLPLSLVDFIGRAVL